MRFLKSQEPEGSVVCVALLSGPVRATQSSATTATTEIGLINGQERI